jgi:hypothetical protein
MMRYKSMLWSFIIALFSLPAFAWQISLEPDESSIQVSNEQNLQQVDVYLVWFDLDAKSSEMFQSWTMTKDWQPGLVPVVAEAIDLSPFEKTSLTSLPSKCPDQHRCALAVVATTPGKDPLAGESHWRASSFLPLNQLAAYERWPGQQVFLSYRDEVYRGGDDEVYAMDMGAEAPTVTTVDEKANEDGESTTETEKPDIFQLVGDKILYANSSAKRFQVIDITDRSQPHLASWTGLTGYPQELYVLSGYYLLLQTDYGNETGALLTVLQESEEGALSVSEEKTLPGYFVESRRRNEVIYTVTQEATPIEMAHEICLGCRYSQQTLVIHVLPFDASTGKFQKAAIKTESVLGYSPTVAIFTDYLVIANHNPQEENWRTTQIQVFDLSQLDNPLVPLPTLTVPGQIPSEFHLSVKNQQLRVVYGPEDREAGSTLAIYDLTSPDMALIGEVGKIAPGEDLFATRFVDDRAFVVTYERKDPLWVIDLADPSAPAILGELEVPGWSEKMFFHDDRLFAVGIDDQPLEGEEARWVQRVALSLFDVADPTKPSLINRLTPLAGEVSYSWSPALDDERALLLDWQQAFAALPINSWETAQGNHLQIVSFSGGELIDAGRIESPVNLQRSFTIEPGLLGGLGDQVLLTLRWGQGKPQVLGQLELATNLTWLNFYDNQLWAAALGDKGYHRFYRYTPPTLEEPAQRWDLTNSYQSVIMADNLVAFYSYNPLTVQLLDVESGELQEVQILEELTEKPLPVDEAIDKTDEESVTEDTESLIASPKMIWYQRSEPLMHDGWFYLAEQRPFKAQSESEVALLPSPENTELVQWILRSWHLKTKKAQEAPTRSIPGKPIAFTAAGDLITSEFTAKGQLRLNRVALAGAGNARLVESRELPCTSYSQMQWTGQSLYLTCNTETGYWYEPPIVIMEDGEANAGGDEAESPVVREEEPKEEPKEEPTPVEPTTQVLKLNPEQGFSEIGTWTFAGSYGINAASEEVVLLSPQWWYYPMPMIDGVPEQAIVKRAQTRSLPPYSNSCMIYRLVAEQEPQLLKELDNCPNQPSLALTNQQIWTAEGFAGIKEIKQ